MAWVNTVIPPEKIHSSRDSVRKARESGLLACNQCPYKFFFSFLCCTSFPPLSFKQFLLRHSPSSYNIVIPIINSVTSVNLKKGGMASRNIVMKKQYTLSWQLCSSLWTSRFFVRRSWTFQTMPVKGAVSRNSAKLGNYKMPVKLREILK